jgi:hypothetical protein
VSEEPRFRLLFDDEIEDQVARLEAAGFPSRATVTFVEGLVSYSPGSFSEEVVRRLVGMFDVETLEELVTRHVITTKPPPPDTDYCRETQAHPGLTAELKKREIQFASGPAGWTVSWGDGEEVTGDSLCRAAVLAVWLRYMREEGGMASPPY